MEIDFPEYKLSCELRGHEDDVRGICVCDNAGIATSSRDRTVRFWPADASGKYKGGSSSKILLGHTSFVGPLAWIPPREEFPKGGLVSGGMDMMVLVWDLRTGEKVQTLRGHKQQVSGLVLDDGDIVSSSVDCTLKRWRNGKSIESWEAHSAAVQAVVKLPSGELVTGSTDTTLKLWRGKTCIHTFTGHTDTIRGLAVMPDFGILSSSHDGSIRLWALTGQVLMELVGHTSLVYSVDSHASGLVVSGSEDCSAKIWKDGACVQSIDHPGCVWDAKFLVNGDLVTACSDGVIRVWTTHEDRIADPVELEFYFSVLSAYKGSRKTVGGLKLEDLPGLEALKTPGTSDGQTKLSGKATMVWHMHGMQKSTSGTRLVRLLMDLMMALSVLCLMEWNMIMYLMLTLETGSPFANYPTIDQVVRIYFILAAGFILLESTSALMFYALGTDAFRDP